MKFPGTIQNGRIKRANTVNELRKQYLSSLKDGTIIIEEIKKFHTHKTKRQLGAWWGLFSKTVLTNFENRGWDTSYFFGLEKPTGIGISSGLLKDYMYSICPSYNEEAKRITMRDMNTIQMATFFNNCRNFAASQWSIYVPEPDKNWKSKKVEQPEKSPLEAAEKVLALNH